MTAAGTAVVVIPLIYPRNFFFLRAAYDSQIFKDQLNEIKSDVERGVLTAKEASPVQNEIGRRLLATERHTNKAIPFATNPQYVSAGVLAISLPALGLAVYLTLGFPSAPELTSLHQSQAEKESTISAAGDLSVRMDELAKRLDNQPNDLTGWLLLGRSYNVMGRHPDAVGAFQQAAALAPFNAEIRATLGESLVFAANGIVEDEAVEVFEELLKINKTNAAARYYLALAQAQRGDIASAFEQWSNLLKDTAENAPYRSQIEARLTEATDDIKLESGSTPPDSFASSVNSNMSTAPGPTAADIAAAKQMSTEDQALMIKGMVEGLARRLEESPDDFEGWLRLARAYIVLEERGKAREAYAQAARLRPGDIGILLDFAGAIIAADESDISVPPRASAILNQVLNLDTENPDALYYLGLADAEAGHQDEAVAKWTRLLIMLEPGSESYMTVRSSLEALLAVP